LVVVCEVFVGCFFDDLGVDFRRHDMHESNDVGILVQEMFFAIASLGNNIMVINLPHVVLYFNPKNVPVFHDQIVGGSIEGAGNDLHNVLSGDGFTLDFRGG
jgi:hypothetical protein